MAFDDKLSYTPVEAIPKIVERCRSGFLSHRLRSVAARKTQIKQLAYMLQDHEAEFVDALKHDLGRPRSEAYLGDVNPVKAEVAHMLKHIDKWVKPESAPTSMVWAGTKPKIYKEPKGVVLIIGPFNYPLGLLLTPLIGALAGGNAAVIKPSEQTEHTAALLARYVPQYFDPELVAVVNGGKDETTALLDIPFDHIFYTGSGAIGKIIGVAAAKNLCPITLELGGKSPAVVLEDSDPKLAARRIFYGKHVNAGQTCIAPDYVLCPKSMQASLVEGFKIARDDFFRETKPIKSDQHGKLCTEVHYNRIKKLLQTTNGDIVVGGAFDDTTRKVETTVVTNVTFDDPLMENELFGPLLPIVSCESPEEAVRVINERDPPLALYVFTNKAKLRDYVFERTRSGGFVHNDTVVQFIIPGLPFGGTGPSGSGNYHGKRTFDTFVHERAYASVPPFFEPFLTARYPPYTSRRLALLSFISGGGKLSFARPGGRAGRL